VKNWGHLETWVTKVLPKCGKLKHLWILYNLMSLHKMQNRSACKFYKPWGICLKCRRKQLHKVINLLVNNILHTNIKRWLNESVQHKKYVLETFKSLFHLLKKCVLNKILWVLCCHVINHVTYLSIVWQMFE
jgi:hypothetical protein